MIDIRVNGNTEYKLESGSENWIIFTRTVRRSAMESSIMESLSIDRDTWEVHCNRTGKETKNWARYYALCVRIEKIFGLSDIKEF